MNNRRYLESLCVVLVTWLAAACSASLDEPRVETQEEDFNVAWKTSFGPGGATIPPLPTQTATPGPGGLTRVEGAIFPANHEVLFIGQNIAGEPVLTPSELLDSFTRSLRLLEQGRAPMVSIDPTVEQLAQGIRPGDAMPVDYFGADFSRLGASMFEADRIMKALSLGRDNLSGQPLGSRVEGYANELDLSHLDRAVNASRWTRFWIEIDTTEIEASENGQTILARPRMIVKARPQLQQRVVDVNGHELRHELIDGDDGDLAPSAREFAAHMSSYYDKPQASLDFSREFPAFRELLSHAALTSIAEAVRSREKHAGDPVYDANWLLREHQLAEYRTAPTTPAITAEKQTVNGNTISVRTLSGGASLEPHNRYASLDAHENELARGVWAARGREPKKKYWSVTYGDKLYHAYSLTYVPSRLRIWQTDLQEDWIAIVREYGQSDPSPRLGRDWFLRMPSVSWSSDMATLASGQRVPRFYEVTDLQGIHRILADIGQMQLPGNPATLSFSDVDQQGRPRHLLHYKNVWLYLDGQVDFVSVGSGPIQMRLAPDAIAMEFSPQPPHQLLRVKHADANDHRYVHEDGRLTRIESSQGRSVEIAYNDDNFVRRITSRTSSAQDGRSVAYQYASNGHLDSLSDESGNSMAYLRDPQTNALRGMRAAFVERPRSFDNFEFKDPAY